MEVALSTKREADSKTMRKIPSKTNKSLQRVAKKTSGRITLAYKPSEIVNEIKIGKGVLEDMITQEAGETVDTLELVKRMYSIEKFYHRSKHLLYLSPDSFVGTNNIVSFLLGVLSENELDSRVFKNPFEKKP